MNTNAKGAKLERRTRDLLKQKGAAFVVRAAGSFGPVDLVAFSEVEIENRGKKTNVSLVQVKANKWPSPVEFTVLGAMSEKLNANSYAFRYNDGIKKPEIKVHFPHSDGIWSDFNFE